jgi:peptidoglycan biosynthesis protein MviN/MurJ (putative lipid II flippase)
LLLVGTTWRWLAAGNPEAPYQRDLLTVSQNIVPAILSQLAYTTPVVIAAFWCAQMETGGLAFIGYSFSLAGFLSVTISTGVATVSLPSLSRQMASRTEIGIGEQLALRVAQTLAFGLPVAAIAVILREPLLAMLLGRGAFNAASIAGTGRVLPYFVVAALCVGAMNVIRNSYYSAGAFRRTAVLGIVNPAMFFVLSPLLAWFLGYVGIALAYGLCWTGTLVAGAGWEPGGHLWRHRQLLWRYLKPVVVGTLGASSATLLCLWFIPGRSPGMILFICSWPWTGSALAVLAYYRGNTGVSLAAG